MKYVVLKNTVIGGKIVRAGDVVDCPANEVNDLLAIGRIAKAENSAVKTVDRAIGLDEETKPKRRTRKKKVD